MFSAALKHVMTGQSSLTVPGDPLLDSNVLLLKTIATNNATNATFVDSSSNGFTVTRTGDVTQGSFSPYAPTGYWSNYFDGSGDWLRRQTFDLSGKPVFTAECWFNPDRTSGINPLCGILTTRNSGVYSPFNICHNGSGQLAWLINGSNGGWNITGGKVTAGQWHHVAISSDGTTIRLFLNGSQLASYGAPTWSGTDYSQMPFIIGANLSENHFFQGFISNARFIIGTAVYTSNFTPPTTPLTAITNTVLLTCQDNRFIDRSSNNFTLTRTGDVSVRRFAPFGLSWDGSLGGSGYFDGSGDYLTFPGTSVQLGSGNFTIEMWYYGNVSTFYGNIIGSTANFETTNSLRITTGPGGNQIVVASGASNVLITASSTFSNSTWIHFALVRSGNVLTLYQNGVSVGTAVNSQSFVADTYYIGSAILGNGAPYPMNAFISDLRIVNGTAVYTANFTPPTTPLTAITNTSLLLNFNNAAVYDATRASNLSLVGDAKTSTGQVKYATTSSLFDGTGDYATILPRPELAVGTGDFTWEAWIRPQTTSPQIWFASPGNGDRSGFAIGMRNGTMWWLIGDGSVWVFERDVGTALSTNNWHHVAVCRANGTARLFVNGSLIDSIANTTNIGQGTRWDIGGYTASYLLTGNMEDLRVSRTARYTSAFTPPARALPVTLDTAGVTPLFVNTTNLVLYLDATNPRSYRGSGSTWYDLSGSSNHATLQSGTGFSNNAITFNGTTGYASVTVPKTGNCTFSCWARTTSLSTAPMLFANLADSTVGVGSPNLWFSGSGGVITWNAFDGAANSFGAAPASVTNGNWHHYAVVNREGTDAVLYYDGQALGSTGARVTTVNNFTTIGGFTNTYMWNGSIGLFTINNTALTASQVLENYDGQKSRFT